MPKVWSKPLSTPFFVCISSEGSGDAARKRVCAQADQIFTTYKIYWADPFLYKAAIFLWKVVVVLSFQFKTLMEAYNEPANQSRYLSHMRKDAHKTCMDIFQVGLDNLFLAWTFIYTFHCLCEQWRLWRCCAQAQVRRLLNMHDQ